MYKGEIVFAIADLVSNNEGQKTVCSRTHLTIEFHIQ